MKVNKIIKYLFVILSIIFSPISFVRSANVVENYRNHIITAHTGEYEGSSNNKALIISLIPDLKSKSMYIPILLYHSVGDISFGKSELYVSETEFEKQMKYLSDNKYTPIHLEEAKNINGLTKPVIITFDDGYKNIYEIAYPILKRYNFKATIFLVSSFIGKDPYLDTQAIMNMRDLVDFQSHTSTHRNLTDLNANEVEAEARESKNMISDITGRPVIALSYPYGSFNEIVANVIKKYYEYGLTINNGVFIPSDPSTRYKIARIYVFRSTDMTNFINHLGSW